jgi:hypothetical protein
MSELAITVEPGWRPDPSGRFEWRYWDGGWTNRVANSIPPTALPAPTGSPASPQAVASPPPSHSPLPSLPAVAAAAPAAAATATAREPFGAATAPAAASPAPPPGVRTRQTPWAWFVGFLRSFADQPESYQSPHSAVAPPPDPRPEHVVAAPGNYGAAGLVALAACGVAVGAYLPWLSGSVDGFAFQRTGFELGHFWAYALGAAILALSALLSVQFRVLRWLTAALTVAMAGFVVRDLLDTYDQMQGMNAVTRVDANLSMGLMIMVVSAAIALIAAVRLTERQKIV